LETFHRQSQIQQSEGSSFLQYSEGPDDGDTPFLSLFSPFSVVNNQLASAEFSRKHNRIALAWV
jgi:hypothetical protein